MATPGPSDESILVDLVARAMDLQERGEPVDPEALCQDRPELLPRVRAALLAHAHVTETLAGPPPAGAEPDAMLGRVLGERYELVRRIGMGAMGSVFAAFDRGLKRHVALKVVEPVLLQDRDRRLRFQREAHSVAALRHPGIVAVHDQGEGEQPFLVMDLVPGLDLEVVIDRRHGATGEPILATFAAVAAEEAAATPRLFTPEELVPDAAVWRQPWPALAARIALGIARALTHAHGHGVLHRDVKPSNVRVRPDGSVVLLDFGLARLPGEGSLTREGMMLGTLAYMPPEQVRGERGAVSERSDVYGLGATLYRLLTAETPFTGAPEVLMRKILWEDPVPVRRLAPEVPRDLAAICHKAIEKRPADRYASAAALAADLEAFLEFRPVSAAPPSTITRVWRRVRRRPERAAAVALVLIGLPVAVWAGQRGVHAREATRRRANLARCAVPALVTIEGFNPAFSIPSERRGSPDPDGLALRRLGLVLEADPSDVEALAMRAMLHLDCGRGPEGLADLRLLLAEHSGSDFLRAVVQRLATGRPWSEPDWRKQLLSDLPPAATAFDFYLRSYLHLRAVRYADGLQDVERALALDPGYVPALHLRPLALIGARDTDRAAAAARHVAGVLGQPTARTWHVLGRERHVAGRLEEAAQAFRQSLELCPDQHGPLQNLASCLFKLGQLEPALTSVDAALAVRPDSVPGLRMKLQILSDLGQQDAIAAIAARYRAPEGGPWWLDLELGVMALPIKGGLVDDPEERGQRCREARTLLSAALAAMDPVTLAPERNQTAIKLRIAKQLEAGDLAGVSTRMLLAMGDEAPDPSVLRDAALLRLRAGNDDGAGEYLLRQAHRLAPSDPITGQALIRFLLEQRSSLAAAQVWQRCFRARPDPRALELRKDILRVAVREQGREGLPKLHELLGEEPEEASQDRAESRASLPNETSQKTR